MPSYREDRDWARHYDDHVQLIICQALRIVSVAPDEDDMRRNTDFQLVYTSSVPQLRISARVRSRRFLDMAGPVASEFANEVTFRYSRPNGRLTEWSKMLSGWGDFMVYGFAEDDEGDRLCAWSIINLALMREHAQHAQADWAPGLLRPFDIRGNRDGSSELIAWRLLNLRCCPRCVGIVHTNVGNHLLAQEQALDRYRALIKRAQQEPT